MKLNKKRTVLYRWIYPQGYEMETEINFVIRRTLVIFRAEWTELILDPAAILCSQVPPDVVLNFLCAKQTLC